MTPKHEATDAMGMESQRDDVRRFRHKKRGTTYDLIGVGRAQGSLHDEDPVVIYRGDDGGLWVRHQAEFSDGRFEEVRSTTQPAEQSGAFHMVPAEPTEAMREAGREAYERVMLRGRHNVLDADKAKWAAMLAAAPAAEQSASSPVEGERLSVARLTGWLERNPHGGTETIHPDDIRNVLAALTTRSVAVSSEAVDLMCAVCRAPRKSAPCHKCGGELTAPAEGWEWPDLPNIDKIRSLAREKGYGLGVHGSLERDLDLIAAPWVEECATPFELASHIANGIDGRIAVTFCDAPHGRIGFNIQQNGWFKIIDLSVMSPALNQARKPEGAEPVAWTHVSSLDFLKRGNATVVYPSADGLAGETVALFTHPAHEAGEVERLRRAIEKALDDVEYQPGDHPVVPIKHDAFVKAVRAALEDKS